MALVSLLFCVACGDSGPVPEGVPLASNAEPADPTLEVRRDEVDDLRALGYLGYAETPADPGASGVVRFDADRSQPGYNLYANRNHASARLMDARGRVLREWHDPGGRHWAKVELLESGDLLVLGSDRVENPGNFVVQEALYILRYAWNGEVVWKKMLRAHHDIEVTPEGQLLTLTYSRRLIPEIDPEIEVEDNGLVLLSQDGEIRETRSLYEILTSDPGLFRIAPVKPRERDGVRWIDLFHSNTIEWMRHEHLVGRDPIYGPRNVLVTSRHQDVIAIFDWDRGQLLWAWGPGEISGPHDATVLASGNILLLDNGLGRGWSRVIELDPLSRRIVWEYRAPVPREFYTKSHGSSQRLSGGNTLIANSGNGQAFEVTPEGEVVWEFLNPRTNDKGERATIVQLRRYPVPLVDAISARAGSGG